MDFVDKPEPEDREPILLDYEQTEKLLAECRQSKNPMLYLYVLTLLETGVRCNSECLWIKWGDVDLDKGRIFIRSSYRHSTKSGKSRHVSMPPRLREAMRDHFAKYRFLAYDGQRSEWVFHHPIDNRTAKAGGADQVDVLWIQTGGEAGRTGPRPPAARLAALVGHAIPGRRGATRERQGRGRPRRLRDHRQVCKHEPRPVSCRLRATVQH